MPAANWLLMAATLFTVLLFRTSDNLAAAYGIAVSGTMLITTILLYRVAVDAVAAGRPRSPFRSSSRSARSTRHSWFPTR